MKLVFTAGLAPLIIQLQAFFTIGLAVLLLNERPRAAHLLSAFVALAGIALVAIHVEGSATLIGLLLISRCRPKFDQRQQRHQNHW